MAEPPSVLHAVCLEHTCDGRKVDLGLKCWRWGRVDDNGLTFWELRRFVHALFRLEQKHVLPSRLIKRLRAKMFRSIGWFWDDVFIETSQRCRATKGAVKGRVRCADVGCSCNSGTVDRGAPQEESACHSAAASTRCQTAPTYNGRCACLNDSLTKLSRLQPMEAHPNIRAMSRSRRPGMFGGPVRLCRPRRVFVIGHGERLKLVCVCVRI